VAGGHFVPCGADDPGAVPDFGRLDIEAVWDREARRFVRKDLTTRAGRQKGRRHRRRKGRP
jgi:hypothetical protein